MSLSPLVQTGKVGGLTSRPEAPHLYLLAPISVMFPLHINTAWFVSFLSFFAHVKGLISDVIPLTVGSCKTVLPLHAL